MSSWPQPWLCPHDVYAEWPRTLYTAYAPNGCYFVFHEKCPACMAEAARIIGDRQMAADRASDRVEV